MFPSSLFRQPAGPTLIRAALLLICLIPQGCQNQNAPAPAGGQAMSPYMRNCAANGVPLPPVWGDPNWVNKGSMPAGKVFDAPEGQTYTDTQVWVYVSTRPKGICYALPRIKGTKIELLGMICQGESGYACFWDNKDPSNNTAVTPKAGLDPAKLADGSNLEEPCIECHRGDNAFLITPGTPLQQEFPGQPVGADDQDGRPTSIDNPPYKPISTLPIPRTGWVNERNNAPPPGTKPVPAAASIPAPSSATVAPPSTPYPSSDVQLPGGRCTSCHSIPKLTPGYCSLAAKMVNNHLMPPSGSTSNPKIAADIKALKEKCNELESGSWP